MEYVRGESLGARLRRERMAPEQVLDIGIQLTDSLVKAHRHGVVHRDLKPGERLSDARGSRQGSRRWPR